jgi:hypothetical protein
VLKDGGTAQWVAEKTLFSSYDIMDILWKLEQKGGQNAVMLKQRKQSLILHQERTSLRPKDRNIFYQQKKVENLENLRKNLRQV